MLRLHLDPCSRLTSVSDVVGTDRSIHEMKRYPWSAIGPRGA